MYTITVLNVSRAYLLTHSLEFIAAFSGESWCSWGHRGGSGQCKPDVYLNEHAILIIKIYHTLLNFGTS